MALIFTSLLFLSIPGILYNNLNNNGLVVSQAVALNCSADPQTPTCQISGNVGCQSSSAYCNLSGSSISFLNSKSPFTQMLQGNFFALFTAVQGPGYSGAGAQNAPFGSHGPFDVVENAPNGGAYYQANCYGAPNGGTSQRSWAINSCTQAATDNFNVTQANAATWTNWNTQKAAFTGTSPFYHLTGNASWTWGCNWLFNVNYTLATNGPGYNYFGCDLVNGLGIGNGFSDVKPTWSLLVAMPVSLGAMPAGNSHQFLFVQLENWETYACAGAAGTSASANAPFRTAGCINFANSFKGVSLPFFPQSTSFVPNAAIATVLGILGGLFLLILGTGLQLGIGGGISVGVNRQGTKLAQVLGLGLIVWTFLYSQFSTWFTSGILPYALDGSLGIVAIVLSGMFFTGVFMQGTTS